MSTLKVTHLQNESNSAPSISISNAVGGGVTFAGISTFHGSIRLGTDIEGHTSADDLTIATSGDTGMTIRSGASNQGSLYFSDATSGNGEFAGWLRYSHQDSNMTIGVAENERLRLTSSGNVNIGPSANANDHGLLTLSQTDLSAFNALVIQQGNTLFTATDGLHIGIDAGVNAYFKLYENRDIYFTTGTSNTEKLRITSDGQVQATGPSSGGSVISSKVTTNNGGYLSYEGIASNGTTTFSVNHNGTIYTASGIQFETSNTATNITSQTLDDYEEGTWTPDIVLGTVSGHKGHYTKVGRLVTVSGYVNNFSDRSSSSPVRVSGLPFADGDSNDSCCGSFFGRYISKPYYGVYMSGDTLYFYGTVNTDYNYVEHDNLSANAGATIYFTATYQTNE